MFSIGHSNHTLEHFLRLLADHQIEVLVDVRSKPYSRYCPHFGKPQLESAIRKANRQYLYLGDALGGMPDGDHARDDNGKVDYRLLAAEESFKTGLARLIHGASQYRVGFMCAEEDPIRCHRFHLITDALQKKNVTVSHIRGDGRVESDADVLARQNHCQAADRDQPLLFQ